VTIPGTQLGLSSLGTAFSMTSNYDLMSDDESQRARADSVRAVLDAMGQAMDRARAGEGGSVIEFLTYRLSDHTTADDARRYRDDAEVKAAWLRDPVVRLRTWLTANGVWSEAEEADWKAECERQVGVEVDAYLATTAQPVEAMFDHLYADPPPDVLAQRAAAIALDQRSLEQRHG